MIESHALLTSYLVTGTLGLLNATLLAFSYHRREFRVRSKARAGVTFSLGVSFVSAVGSLGLVRAAEIVAGGSRGVSTWLWALVAVLSIAITISMLIPASAWKDAEHE